MNSTTNRDHDENSQCKQPEKSPALPGYGLPVGYIPTDPVTGKCFLFPSALDPLDVFRGDIRSYFMTQAEIDMMSLMNFITDQPGWVGKVSDDKFMHRWIHSAYGTENISKAMAQYCIQELQYKATLFETCKAVSVYTTHGFVVKSDTAIPKSIQETLKLASPALELDKAGGFFPWRVDQQGHSGGGRDARQVVHLVDPSLFPLAYERSRILPNGVPQGGVRAGGGIMDCLKYSGAGMSVPPANTVFTTDLGMTDLTDLHPEIDWAFVAGAEFGRWAAATDNTYHQVPSRFQWLPCNVDFKSSPSGPKGEPVAKIVSYINNLHPRIHANLYHIIEQVIDLAIPLWNMTLSNHGYCPRVPWHDIDRYGPVPDEARLACGTHVRIPRIPNVTGPFMAPSLNPNGSSDQNYNINQRRIPRIVDLKDHYRKTGLQVIVKMSNIHLTPEKPEYPAGEWRAEGRMNEHICATAIYFYDIQNIIPSRISFRNCCGPVRGSNGPLGDDVWVDTVFKHHRSPSGHLLNVQEIGGINALPGRLVTFPNSLHHKVESISLANGSLPGHCKTLELFLVDPNIRIISTAEIMPQQRDWWMLEIMSSKDTRIGCLPVELQWEIMKYVEGDSGEVLSLMSAGEAEEIKGHLLHESMPLWEYARYGFESGCFWQDFYDEWAYYQRDSCPDEVLYDHLGEFPSTEEQCDYLQDRFEQQYQDEEIYLREQYCEGEQDDDYEQAYHELDDLDDPDEVLPSYLYVEWAFAEEEEDRDHALACYEADQFERDHQDEELYLRECDEEKSYFYYEQEYYDHLAFWEQDRLEDGESELEDDESELEEDWIQGH